MHRSTLILQQFLLLYFTVSMSACTTGTSTPAECRGRAVQWMIDNQNPDGSWGTIDSSRPYQIYLDTRQRLPHAAFGDPRVSLPVKGDAAALGGSVEGPGS